MSRYSRQEVLPQVGEGGQTRLGQATVLVLGLGALGTNAASLLARAGVGTMRLVDRDVVELSNLQRQVLFSEADLNRPKAVAAAERLRAINSEIRIESRVKDVSAGNVGDLLAGVDLVLDGTDNLETRLVLNDACVQSGLPWVYAAVVATHGMVLPITPHNTACFRCLVPSLPAPGTMETCDTAGILNSVSHAVSGFEVTEGLRLLLGHPPLGHLLVFEGWEPELRRIRIGRRPGCPACEAGRYEFLETRGGGIATSLCGRDSVSVDPGLSRDIDLEGVAQKLAGRGTVRRIDGLVMAEVDGFHLTVFADGRAIVRGTDDPPIARSVYSKYIGN